ncbi:phage antirepressor [Paenibacillus sp. NEAU-GSW1]|uniref:phage antirepressor n=1 Tax=Paenibacillus sp. NEAU-GSW1 TaxID=2682486 RepID=UPI0015640067|nr:phage antirepressor [Paenibacillus sp. NEAU-GSW1]
MNIFKFSQNEVRVIEVSGEPWFVLNDLVNILGLSNARMVKERLTDDVSSTYPIPDALGRMQETTIVNEDGLYDVILESRKPEAKAFRKWITSEVLPSIRKTGSYSVQHQFQLPQTMPEALRLLAAEMEEKQQIQIEKDRLALQTAEQQAKLREQEAPIAIYNLAISAKNTMTMQEVAKALGTGRTRLYNILRETGLIMTSSTLPYQRYLDAGYFKVVERPRQSGDSIVNDTATRVTAKGFDYIARMMQKRNEIHLVQEA